MNRNIIAACQVLQGFYGYGADRVRRLENAGYDYKTVQTMVNRMLQGLPPEEGGTLDPSKVREKLREFFPDAAEIDSLINQMAEVLTNENQ